MQGRQERDQEELFVAGSLVDLIPEDHLLRRVDAVLDLSWLDDVVRDCYCQDIGRPSIDPESALRLMLAGFFEGIVHDRALMRRAQTDVAFRWFAGYRVDERLPDHSSLTRIRQRWGVARFRAIFHRTVQACVDAGLVGGGTVHVDASLIRADVSWESLTTEHVAQVVEANAMEEAVAEEQPEPPKRPRGRPRTKPPKPKKRSTTDPDATMAASRSDQRLEPTYKQHTAVDDESGVIVDVALTTGERNEGQELLDQLGRVEDATATRVTAVTADAGYAHANNYAALEQRGADAVIPPPSTAKRPKRIPLSRFRYDARRNIVRCPGGKTLHRQGRSSSPGGWRYSARAGDCRACPLRKRCFSDKAKARTLVIVDGYEALLRARRRKARGWDEATRERYTRHRWRVEGVHGQAKTQHGLRRAVRRGLDNVAIQVYLTGRCDEPQTARHGGGCGATQHFGVL